MAVYRCRLIPLTPIHVGAGETIALEDYFLANGKLTRFHPPAVLRAMSDAERNRYMGLLSGGDTNMGDALKLLRDCAQKTPGSWIYSIEVGAASRQSLAEALNKVETSRGEVHPLIWNEVRCEAVLPGSAIKGAIRTALLSGIVAGRIGKEREWADNWKRKIEEKGRENPRRVAFLAQELEAEVFRKGQQGLEYDPFRFVKVSDARVPSACVRLDRVMLLSRSERDSSAKIQMHFERVISAADGGKAPVLEFDLTIEKEEKKWHGGISGYLGGVPSLERLLQSMQYHYDNRVHSEMTRFAELYQSQQWVEWRTACRKPGCTLIRLGRFSHFESLSVEGLRKTQDRLGRWIEKGTSRTYCTPDGTKKMPFGWALLQVL
jgi:CRISPR-associated protein Csm5